MKKIDATRGTADETAGSGPVRPPTAMARRRRRCTSCHCGVPEHAPAGRCGADASPMSAGDLRSYNFPVRSRSYGFASPLRTAIAPRQSPLSVNRPSAHARPVRLARKAGVEERPRTREGGRGPRGKSVHWHRAIYLCGGDAATRPCPRKVRRQLTVGKPTLGGSAGATSKAICARAGRWRRSRGKDAATEAPIPRHQRRGDEVAGLWR